MFELTYSNFINNSFYSDFSISYMTGLKVSDIRNAIVIVNVDSKTAFVYLGK